MSNRSFHLSELKSNPELMKSLMETVAKPEEDKKKKKIKKSKFKVKKKKIEVEGPIVVAAPQEEEQPKTKEKPIVVRHDDAENLKKHSMVAKLIKMAEGYFNQNIPAYASMEPLFSTAYSLCDIKNRAFVARARNISKEAVALVAAKEKFKAAWKAKGKSLRDAKQELKKYSLTEINEEFVLLFKEIFENIALEDKKKEGTFYNDTHKQFAMDLSSHDATPSAVVLARANIMVSVSQRVDIEHLKRAKKQIEVVHIDGPIYVIKNALLVGCMNFAVPKKITEESLEALMASNFQVIANPIPKMLRHTTSSRAWFYVPEYSEIQVKTLAFADRSMNQEFEAFRMLSNNPNENDIRFIFLQTGASEERIDEIINRWKSSDSHQTRLAILTNEYATVVRMMKSQRLRKRREEFLESNSELITTSKKMKDRIQQIEEEKEGIKNRFSLLASHTGNVEQGLPISRYKHVTTIFSQIERAAVRGNTSIYERIRIRRNIHKDKIECRTLNYEYKDITNEAKQLAVKIKASAKELDHRREQVFSESH